MKTTQLKKVLIALDYNPVALKVVEAGFSLAKAMEAEIILTHVITDPIYYSTLEYSPIMGFSNNQEITPIQLESFEGLKKAAQHFLDKTKHHLENEIIQTVVGEGNIAESILKTAKDWHVDVIVLGTHSQKWLENIIVGSVAKDILNHSQIPLFIVPTKKRR